MLKLLQPEKRRCVINMRCKLCQKVVRYPAQHSKDLRMCGNCQKLNQKGGEQFQFIIRYGGSRYN